MPEITATVKYGASYEDPWLTFKGASAPEVKAAIIEAFELDGTARKLSLAWVVQEASRMATSSQILSSKLGATPVIEEGGKEDPWATAEAGADKNVWPEEKESPADQMRRLIAGCGSVEELKRLWVDNQTAFQDPDLMAAYKARGRELKNAG